MVGIVPSWHRWAAQGRVPLREFLAEPLTRDAIDQMLSWLN